MSEYLRIRREEEHSTGAFLARRGAPRVEMEALLRYTRKIGLRESSERRRLP